MNMIVVTGAAGFIGSCLAKDRMSKGDEVILVDDFSRTDKQQNLAALGGAKQIDRNVFIEWLKTAPPIKAIFHIGARTDTTEMDGHVFDKLNLDYTKKLWTHCASLNIPLIYASSAATYGGGEHGYYDDHSLLSRLRPLNPYGESKNEFDKWALAQDQKPPHWYGMKFFNVYGPNEYHKGRMASVVYHAFRQISESGAMQLFRSHNPQYKDGEQLRDFVYVNDVLNVIDFLHRTRPQSGIYNLGTGTARTFLDLAKAVFAAMDKEPQISFIDTPIDIRNKYQYFTEAKMAKLLQAGYDLPFTPLEAGVEDYVRNYLMEGRCF